MTDIEKVLASTKDLAPAKRKEALIPFANNTGIGQMVFMLASGKDKRTVLRALTDLAQKKNEKSIIARYAAIHRDLFLRLLADPDVKTRKTAAQLIGRVCADDFSEALLSRLNSEENGIVLPSLILAIGTLSDKPAAKSALEGYEVRFGSDKQLEEQRTAIEKATEALSDEEIEIRIYDTPPHASVILECPSTRVTQRELAALGYSAKQLPHAPGYLLASDVEKFSSIYRARSFYDAALYLGCAENMRGAIAIVAKSEKIMAAMFGKSAKYRVEVSGQMPADYRKRAIDAAMSVIHSFKNSVSNFHFEIRLLKLGKEVHVALAPAPNFDGRFLYRRASISASAHPAVAAACVSFIAPFLNPEADVLDCFCGSGTMLFERAQFPYKSLTGTDISNEALRAARLNERAAKKGAHFLIKNAGTPFEKQYDEIISNMPFGNRVGSHSHNKSLYTAFLGNLKGTLKPGGKAFLFTHEKRLLSELLADTDATIVAQHTFAAGGLFPTMFVITF